MKKEIWCFLTAVLMACVPAGCDYESTEVTSESCSLKCRPGFEVPTDSGNFVCALLGGKEICVPDCLGKNNGENKPVCVHAHPGSDVFSVTDTCALDELGTLYSVSHTSEKCAYTCESGICQPSLESSCKKDCRMDGGRQMTCVRINGEESCKPVCLGPNEGVNTPECWRNASLGPNGVDLSVTDTCAKDELGTLYVTTSTSETCTHGCESGECKQSPEITACTKNCDATDICVRISGEENCKSACLGNKSGENKVCFENPDSHEVFSVMDTCTLDELGSLYSESRVTGAKCDNGCEDGECQPPSVSTCTKNCQSEGGRPRICVRLSGHEECKTRCAGEVSGVNQPVCYMEASLPPGQNEFTLTDTCASDELGTLYSVSENINKCDNGCESGICKSVAECSLTCSPDQFNRLTICVKSAGVEGCKPECSGTKIGENAPVCYKSDSSLPYSPEYVLIDTCVLSDGGTLYSESTTTRPCLNGCKDNACILCNKDCMIAGGMPSSCYVISGVSQCKNNCLSPDPRVGVNALYCYLPYSLGPGAKPVSLTATCVEDDNGRFYMESHKSVGCSSTCTDGVCE